MISTVNASVVGASGQQCQAWPQRAHCGVLFRNANNRFGLGAGRSRQACPFRAEFRRSAAARTNSIGVACSASRKILPAQKLYSRSLEYQQSSDSPAELLVKLSCRFVEVIAAVVLTTQQLPAQAGEIIQGMPRVADGDTLQVSPDRLHTAWHVYGCFSVSGTLLCTVSPCFNASFGATAHADHMQIEGQKIRLYGFDAPEKAQLCKNAAGADYSCGK